MPLIHYDRFNRCTHCEENYSKEVDRCPKCGRLLRKKPLAANRRHNTKYRARLAKDKNPPAMTAIND